VDLDGAGRADGAVDDGAVQQLVGGGPAGRPEDEIGGVLPAGEVGECAGRVRAREFGIAAAELGE
jgi:hypothetical protein